MSDSSRNPPRPSGAASLRLSLSAQDLHLWLCSRACAASSDEFKRSVLSRYAGVAPGSLGFEENEHGKPAVVGAARPLDFNLSHSGDRLICAVTAGAPVGVDMEYLKPARASLKVARRFFREEEAAVLEACDEVALVQRFYDFWTLKESAVKARGEALAPGLSAHGFRLEFPDNKPGETGRIAVESAAPDDAHYMLLDPLAEYRVAVCWMGGAGRSPQTRLFELNDRGEAIERDVQLRADKLPQ